MSQPTTSSDRPLPNGLRIMHLTVSQDQESLTHFAQAEASSACCPICGSCSEHIHSHYIRTISDLPWRRIAVALEVRARKFFCNREGCERRIFCERLVEVPARSKTRRPGIL